MRVYSSFDGMSCGQVALKRANIPVSTYLASEIDKYAIAVAQYNFPKTVQMGDINNVNPHDIKDIDLMISGSPCQDVSFSGKGKGLIDGERSNLFFKWAEHLDIIKPKFFLLENVRMKQEYQDIISDILGVQPTMIPSSLVSAQKRDRWYWTNIPFEMPKDKNIYLKDIVEDGVVDRDKSFCLDANYWKGGNLRSYFVKNRRQLVFDNHRCIQVGIADVKGHDVLKRVYSREGKSPTLNSMNGGNREPKVICGQMIGRKINPKTNKRDDYNPNIKTEQRIELRGDDKTGALTTVQKDNLVVTDKYWRALTPKECERLQTLDDDYTMFGDFDTPPNIIDDDYFIKPISKTQRYKMLGNGWCVDVVAEIFNGLRRVL
jgi:site-specific DNA-cytosine methylase